MAEHTDFTARHETKLEAEGTSACKPGVNTALTILLLTAQFQLAPGAFEPAQYTQIAQDATQGTPDEVETRGVVSETMVLQEVHRIYDELVSNPLVLDEDARRALYENAWDLYE